MEWSAHQYTQFENERTRPVRDLLAQVYPAKPLLTAADIGCGPGNSTGVLREHFADARISGIDSSAAMIASARERHADIEFRVADITAWSREPEQYDLILANASLQWIPNHEELLPRLLAKLQPGGTLAVQVPDNQQEPVHLLMQKVASDLRWSSALADARGILANRQSADWYYRTLTRYEARADVWKTTYFHVLKDGPRGVVDWFRSTGLRPYLSALSGEDQASFLDLYESEIAKAYPALLDGSVLLPFPRLFFIATCRD